MVGQIKGALELGVIEENNNVLVAGVACEYFPNLFEIVKVKELLQL